MLVTRTRMDFIFWKRRPEIFLQLSFKENLYENKYKAFVIYRETEILSRRRFLKSFSSSISFSNLLFIFYLHHNIHYPSLNKLRKTFIAQLT